MNHLSLKFNMRAQKQLVEAEIPELIRIKKKNKKVSRKTKT